MLFSHDNWPVISLCVNILSPGVGDCVLRVRGYQMSRLKTENQRIERILKIQVAYEATNCVLQHSLFLKKGGFLCSADTRKKFHQGNWYHFFTGFCFALINPSWNFYFWTLKSRVISIILYSLLLLKFWTFMISTGLRANTTAFCQGV